MTEQKVIEKVKACQILAFFVFFLVHLWLFFQKAPFHKASFISSSTYPTEPML